MGDVQACYIASRELISKLPLAHINGIFDEEFRELWLYEIAQLTWTISWMYLMEAPSHGMASL